MKSITMLSVVLMIVFLVIGVGAGYVLGGSGAAAHTSTSTVTTATVNTSGEINYWIQAYKSSEFNGDFQISRTTLASLLNAGNTSIYIIDVRQANGTASYATGHIPGAMNIPFQNMTTAVENSLIPTNKILVIVCYTGQTGSITTTLLRLLGYNAFNLSGGMAAWNNATRVSAAAPIAVGLNYPLQTGSTVGTWSYFNTTAP